MKRPIGRPRIVGREINPKDFRFVPSGSDPNLKFRVPIFDSGELNAGSQQRIVLSGAIDTLKKKLNQFSEQTFFRLWILRAMLWKENSRIEYERQGRLLRALRGNMKRGAKKKTVLRNLYRAIGEFGNGRILLRDFEEIWSLRVVKKIIKNLSDTHAHPLRSYCLHFNLKANHTYKDPVTYKGAEPQLITRILYEELIAYCRSNNIPADIIPCQDVLLSRVQHTLSKC